MRKLLVAVGVAAALFGCAERKSSAPLIGGYKVFAASSCEVALANPGNTYIVGPRLESIGTSAHIIVAMCGHGCVVHLDPLTAARYAVVDSRSGAIQLANYEYEAQELVRAAGVSWPELRNPSEYFEVDR